MKLASYLIILIAFWSCTIEQQSEYDLIINGIDLIDGTGDSMMSAVNIYVLNDRISKITSDPIGNATSDIIIDGKGKYLIPGLIDAHFHLLHGTDKFERSLRQLIHFGVTGILIPGGSVRYTQGTR